VERPPLVVAHANAPAFEARLAALTCLLEVIGPDRVRFSLDYPYGRSEEGRDFVMGVPISEADHEKLGFANAARLLGLGSSLREQLRQEVD
jgi:uncharacterized protein